MKERDLWMTIINVTSQFKITQSVSTLKLSKALDANTNDHLFYKILWDLSWLSYAIDISGIVHYHYSNLVFIITALALIFITLIKVYI
jgi:hypothetical protein